MKHFIITWTLAVVSATSVLASPTGTTGDRLQADFGMAIESGQAPRVLKMLSPEIRGEVDEAVLQRLLDQIRIKLGRRKSSKQTSVRSVRRDGHHVIDSTAEVVYAKGTATIKLKAVDGKLVGFDYDSKALGDWFDRPANNKQYEEMGTQFVRAMLIGNEARAFRMLHASLQEQLGPDFKSMTQSARKTIEPEHGLKVAVRNSRMVETKGTPKLLIDLDLFNGETTGTCEIQIQFVGMRGHLTGFHFNK